MKNFKKVLALVLAVATVFAFTAMTSAADVTYADFTDTANITHKEAVQVLTGIGVINGFEDKTFKPAESVTRVQMAKMVGYIMNDGDDINDLYKAACPFADSKTNWGAGYIAYCATQGIVNGRDANTFDPNATVTGVEAAKMLLCALGYDATIEGFTGADWAVNVLNTAKKANLLKDLSQGKMNAALNREDAAQMIFNALKAKTVTYDNKGTTVSINGATIATGASKAEGTKEEHLGFTGNAETYWLWGEEHFIDSSDTAKQLKIKPGMEDDFGIASTIWQYGKDDNGPIEIAKTLTLAKTFTGVVTAQDIYALTGKIAAEDVIYVKLDGVDDADLSGAADLAAWESGAAVNDYSATARAKNKLFADEIEVYIDDQAAPATGRDIQIIAKNYYVGAITQHKAAKTAADKEYVIITDEYGLGLDNNTGKYETTAFTDADADDETEVILTFSKKVNAIESVAKVTAVKSGAVKKISTDADNNVVITADGKTYTANRAYAFAPAADAEYDLFLDPNGKVIFADELKSGSKNYFMVMNAVKSNSTTLDEKVDTYQVRLLGTDGKTVDLKVAEINGVKNNAGAAFNTEWAKVYGTDDAPKYATIPAEDQEINLCKTGVIVTYTLNNKGEAKLSTAGDFTTDSKVIAANYDNLTNIATMLTTKKATSRTTFVLISLDKNDNYVFTPVSGISAMKAALGNYNYYKNIVVNDEPSNGAAYDAAVAFIFVDARNATSTKTVFTTRGMSAPKFEVNDGKTTWFYEVNAIEGNEVKTLKVEQSEFDAKVTADYVVATNYTTDDNGFITKITKASADWSDTFAPTAFEYKNGALTINDTVFTQDEVKVFLYDVAEDEFDVRNARNVKLADIDVGETMTIVFNTNSSTSTKTVTAVYAIANP